MGWESGVSAGWPDVALWVGMSVLVGSARIGDRWVAVGSVRTLMLVGFVTAGRAWQEIKITAINSGSSLDARMV